MNITVNFNLPEDTLIYNIFTHSETMYDLIQDLRDTLYQYEKNDETMNETDMENFLQRANELLYDIE